MRATTIAPDHRATCPNAGPTVWMRRKSGGVEWRLGEGNPKITGGSLGDRCNIAGNRSNPYLGFTVRYHKKDNDMKASSHSTDAAGGNMCGIRTNKQRAYQGRNPY